LSVSRVPISNFAFGTKAAAEAVVACRRLDKLLNTPEVPPRHVDPIRGAEAIQRGLVVDVSKADYAWDSSNGRPENATLAEFELQIAKGETVAIVGSVGSGKSSVLAAIMGELVTTTSSVALPHIFVHGSLAFSPQRPWILSETVQNNILFGSPMDTEYYWSVVRACELLQDMESWPAYDLSEVGERGLNLSGGQKQRLSLARAIYSNRDVVLLDDPLSAVDAHVGDRIFRNAIQGVLKGRTVIMVTNALNILADFDRVIVMKDGVIVEQGKFASLMESEHGELRRIVHEADRKSTSPSSTPLHTPDPERRVSFDERNGGAPPKSPKSPKRRSTRGIKEALKKGKLVSEEDQKVGEVSWSVYKKYMSAAGGYVVAVCVALLYVMAQLNRVGVGEFLVIKNASQCIL
jgi:ABC-type multidrug transport system fused ATPase/permease subunit